MSPYRTVSRWTGKHATTLEVFKMDVRALVSSDVENETLSRDTSTVSLDTRNHMGNQNQRNHQILSSCLTNDFGDLFS